ncbi:MAG: hypothetical protein ACRC4M_04550 [Mycoplasma sp.]
MKKLTKDDLLLERYLTTKPTNYFSWDIKDTYNKSLKIKNDWEKNQNLSIEHVGSDLILRFYYENFVIQNIIPFPQEGNSIVTEKPSVERIEQFFSYEDYYNMHDFLKTQDGDSKINYFITENGMMVEKGETFYNLQSNGRPNNSLISKMPNKDAIEFELKMSDLQNIKKAYDSLQTKEKRLIEDCYFRQNNDLSIDVILKLNDKLEVGYTFKYDRKIHNFSLNIGLLNFLISCEEQNDLNKTKDVLFLVDKDVVYNETGGLQIKSFNYFYVIKKIENINDLIYKNNEWLKEPLEKIEKELKDNGIKLNKFADVDKKNNSNRDKTKNVFILFSFRTENEDDFEREDEDYSLKTYKRILINANKHVEITDKILKKHFKKVMYAGGSFFWVDSEIEK